MAQPATIEQLYVPVSGTPKTIICDLDGTLALMNGRDPFDASSCENDLLNVPVHTILKTFQNQNNQYNTIVFVSGRSDKYRAETERWLEKVAKFTHFMLFMRKEGDFRKDSIVKLEIFNKHIRNDYDVSFVLDDRNQVVEMWRSLGLTCMQVADGNF